jgi:DAK2 domain fusion protein YloV
MKKAQERPSQGSASGNLTEPERIDGHLLRHLAKAGLAWLSVNQQTVNALNVFPVPDGDTGTNMLLTMQAACQEMGETREPNVGKVAHTLAHGALMGARGNSGVILSQLWRGLSRSLDQIPAADSAALARAFAAARDTAYQGVVRPVEGTILTVATEVAREAQAAADAGASPVALLERIVAAADQAVLNTPNLLPVLREAGVVDSGGKGLFFILEGMLRFAKDQPLDTPMITVQPLSALNLRTAEEAAEEGQDFEVVIDFHPGEPLNLESFYARLQEMGTSIQLGQGDEFYRLHIHVPTEKRYEPIDYVMGIGSVSKIAVENLQAQMANRSQGDGGDEALRLASVTPGQLAAIAVAPGPGIARVFASLGVAAIVSGGQTMNPSTQEILNAFESLPTDRILILPNNKNIQLAAEQARELTVKQVRVIPARTIPQGIASMLSFASDGDLDTVAQAMTQALSLVESGEITLATRSVELNGVRVNEGQVIGLHNGTLVVSGDSIEAALLALLEHMHAGEHELVTLYYGSDLTAAQVNPIADRVRERFTSQEVELHDGGQPHYPFILSVE